MLLSGRLAKMCCRQKVFLVHRHVDAYMGVGLQRMFARIRFSNL
jgi:hypothetical protein